MNRPPRFLRLLVALLASLPLSAQAGYQITGKPTVRFFAEGRPGALDIEGTTSEITLVEEGDDFVLRVPMATVSTGIALRDRHMRNEYVEVDLHPDATLRFPAQALTFPEEKGATTSGTVEATFTVHGVDARRTVTWTLKRSKDGWQARGSFDFDTSQHGITIPSYLGITVEPQMRAEARFDLVWIED